MEIARGHKVGLSCIGSPLEVCIFVVNLEQAFEEELQIILNIDEARQCSLARVSGEEINRDD